MSVQEYQRLPEETEERNSRSPGTGSLGQSNERSSRSIHDDDRDRRSNSRERHGDGRDYHGNSPGNRENGHGPSTEVRSGGDIEARSGGSRKSETNDPSDEPGLRPSWSYMRRQMTSHCVLVVTLLLMNAAQLKTLIVTEDASRDELWSASVVLVAVSLTLLTCLTILVTLTGLHRVFSRQHLFVSARLTDASVLCSVLVLLCNIFTTIIGLSQL